MVSTLQMYNENKNLRRYSISGFYLLFRCFSNAPRLELHSGSNKTRHFQQTDVLSLPNGVRLKRVTDLRRAEAMKAKREYSTKYSQRFHEYALIQI